MKFFVNELSFIRQANSNYEADILMEKLSEIIEAIEPLKRNDPLQTHSSLSARALSSDLSLRQWLFQKQKSSNSREQKFAKALLIMLKQGPFIDTQGLVDNCKCYLNSEDVSSSSIAGAAYDNGVLISLQNDPNFQSDFISVNFSENNQAFQIREIQNLTDVTQANKIRRSYVPSLKHQKGGWGTYMDLTDVEAQAALDTGLPSGKQIYSFYNNKYYEFQNDNAGGFHGYPVDRQNVPPKIIKQLEQ